MKRLVQRMRRGVILRPDWLRVRGDVRRRGWASLPLCNDAETQFWTYTIGFDETLDHPEIVISGHSPRLTDEVLGRVCDAVKNGELAVEDGLRWEPCGYGPYVWRKVNWLRLTDEWFLMAKYRRWERTGSGAGLRAYQLVLPDVNGLFPWEPGYDEAFGACSPKLWRPGLNTEVAAKGCV